jgi:hypothetical protein
MAKKTAKKGSAKKAAPKKKAGASKKAAPKKKGAQKQVQRTKNPSGTRPVEGPRRGSASTQPQDAGPEQLNTGGGVHAPVAQQEMARQKKADVQVALGAAGSPTPLVGK